MNGKKAKEMRRKAAALTVGKPMVSYGRKMQRDAAGRNILRQNHPDGTELVLGDCTRRVYKSIKRGAL